MVILQWDRYMKVEMQVECYHFLLTSKPFNFVNIDLLNKRDQKPNGLSEIDIPETQATICTKNKIKSTTQRTKKMSNTSPIKLFYPNNIMQNKNSFRFCYILIYVVNMVV